MKVFLVLIALAGVAHAEPNDTVYYRVKTGDTLELIAAEFYGDRAQAAWIAEENHLTKSKKISAGDRIKIPVTREIVTNKGDHFESLATTYLGDASRAPYLAEANDRAIDESLATGTTLVIPLRVTYVAPAAESLANVSQAFFGDAKQTALLQKYNNLDKPQLDKGDSIVVPALHLRVKANKQLPPDGEGKARREQAREAAAKVAAALPAAKAAWASGDFAAVKSALEPFADKLDMLDANTAVDLGMLLGRAHVAFGETTAAVTVFEQVWARRPSLVLHPYRESPKVLEAWRKAGGHAEGE